DAGRPAGQDDGRGLSHRGRLRGLVIRDDLAIDAAFAHPPRDELRDLAAEIDDQNIIGQCALETLAARIPTNQFAEDFDLYDTTRSLSSLYSAQLGPQRRDRRCSLACAPSRSAAERSACPPQLSACSSLGSISSAKLKYFLARSLSPARCAVRPR